MLEYRKTNVISLLNSGGFLLRSTFDHTGCKKSLSEAEVHSVYIHLLLINQCVIKQKLLLGIYFFFKKKADIYDVTQCNACIYETTYRRVCAVVLVARQEAEREATKQHELLAI